MNMFSLYWNTGDNLGSTRNSGGVERVRAPPRDKFNIKNICDMETMNHQFRSLYHDNVFCDIIGYCLNGNAKCIVTTYGKRGKAKKVQQSLPADCLEGPFANFKRMNG